MVNRKQFRIDLKDDYLHHFNEIKKREGLQKNIDVFRHCLTKAATGSNKDFHISEEIYSRLTNYLKRDDVRQKFIINSINDCVNLALQNFINSLEEYAEMRSLTHWDVRSILDDEKREIALAFRDCQLQSETADVSVKELAYYMNRKDLKTLEGFLDNFVDKGLLEYDEYQGKKRYHG